LSPADIRALVDHYIDACNRKDIDDMLMGIHPNDRRQLNMPTLHDPAFEATCAKSRAGASTAR
jgi:hypothetical protein